MSLPPPPPPRIIESPGRRALWQYFPSRSNDCPGYMWVFDRAYGKSEVKTWICGSPQHIYEPCAIRYVTDQIAHLNEKFHRHRVEDGELVPTETIYFTSTTYDPVVLNRLNQRRYAQGGGYAVVRRGRGPVDGQSSTVHIYASVPYRGDKWPTEADWETMAPGEAMEYAAKRSLLIPGLFSAKGVTPVSYSGDWQIPKDRTRKQDDPERIVTLGLARSESVFRAAERVMTVITNVHLGITPDQPHTPVTFSDIPAEWRDWWVDTTWSIVGVLNSGKPEGEVLATWLRAKAGDA